jgi:fructose-1,6-bisphosphatase II
MTEDLVGGRDVFFAATGITNGALLQGVRYDDFGAVTYSLVMRSRSGTIRFMESRHNFEKLETYSRIAYRR